MSDSEKPWSIPEEETGFPRVSGEKWKCTGRSLTQAYVGRTFECYGSIPDIGGSVDSRNSDENLSFESKWVQRDPWMEGLFAGLWGSPKVRLVVQLFLLGVVGVGLGTVALAIMRKS